MTVRDNLIVTKGSRLDWRGTFLMEECTGDKRIAINWNVHEIDNPDEKDEPMMSKHLTYSLVLCVLLSMMAGCGFETKPVKLHATGVQVLDREKNEHFVVDQVRHGDVSRSYASFTWPEAGSAGYHEARWDLFHKGKRIRAG